MVVQSQFISQFGSSSRCPKEELKKNVDEMFIGPFGSSLKNDCFVEKEDGYCVVYEQKHAIEKRNDLPFRYVSQKKYQELKRFEVLPGDIIVSCRGTIGEVYRIPEGSPRGIMHPSIMKIRLKKESYCSEYFVFAVSEYMKERESMNLGTGVKMAVTATDMGKELFAKPSISSQMSFISIIHQADKSKFDGLKSQFIEMFGLPSANHKAFKIGCIADIVSDIHYGTSRQSVENGDYPYLRMNNITYTGELDLSDLKRISIPEEELSGCIVKKGDVLFNRTNSKDLVGKTCSFPFEQPMVIAGYIIRLRMNGLVLPEYLSVFLNLSCSKKMLRDLSKGAVGQANINAKEVQSITILIPPIELQNQFVVIKNQADKSKYLS